jgi:hypothetical protein
MPDPKANILVAFYSRDGPVEALGHRFAWVSTAEEVSSNGYFPTKCSTPLLPSTHTHSISSVSNIRFGWSLMVHGRV